MDAHARTRATEQHPRPLECTGRRVGLLLEYLAIAGGYVLLGWLGLVLIPDGRLVAIWPAGGFALAMLLLRGTSRWPAILLGSLIGSCVFRSWSWVLETGANESTARAYAAAVLTSVARTSSTVVGVWLLHRFVGTVRWPRSVRGVLGFILIGGLALPALAAVTTHAALLLGGLVEPGPEFFRKTWIWFNANATGVLTVAPAILALSAGPIGRPRRSRWEVALAIASALAGGLAAIELRRRYGEAGIPLAYPVIPVMLWGTLRFGAQGAVLFNLLVTCVTLASMRMPGYGEDLSRTFTQLQARQVVFLGFILVLAAAFEERHQMRQSLERERQGLEARVAERTREIARFLSLLHSSLESTADGLLVVDREGRITAMNQRFAELWKLPPSILESGDDARALTAVREQLVDPEAFLSRVEHLYAHPELESEDEVALTDGRVFHRVSRPQRLGEEIVGRVWSFRDITVRRRAEAERDHLLVEESRARQEVERAFQEAQKALGLRDEFLSIAAHEMKTPLTSMKVQIQHLQRVMDRASGGQVDASRLRPVVAGALLQMRRFQELSDQLLDLARLASGRLEPCYEPLDFREVVAEQLRRHEEAAAKARSELHLECDESILGECDRLRLEHIVNNLLSNAIKFGAGRPVAVRLEAPAGFVCIQVRDQGIGIASEDHGRIFERLERAVDSRHYGGLGLGLWIARQSAKVLGGDITLESEPEKGSTFTVELPRTRQPPLERERGPSVSEAHPPV